MIGAGPFTLCFGRKEPGARRAVGVFLVPNDQDGTSIESPVFGYGLCVPIGHCRKYH